MSELPITDPLKEKPIREFRLFSAFALAFSDVSPIVGLYSVFAIGIVAAGPAFFWALPVVLLGQLLVTGVFGELVSRWPFQGSVYAWSTRLIGPRYGWITNWAYMWGLTMALSAVALAAAQFLAAALGFNSPSSIALQLLALAVLVAGSFANLIGPKLLKGLLYVTIVAELVASLGIGAALLFFHRVQPVSVLLSGAGTAHGTHWLFGPFLLVVAFAGFSFLGFESAGSIAEEVKEARQVLPRAITLSLLAAGVLVMFAALGVILAVPNLGAVLSGKESNPIATTLTADLGAGSAKALLVVLAIGFTSSMIAVQTAVTRAIWASARDKLIPGSKFLGRLSGPDNLPRYAIGLTAVVAGALLFISTSSIYTLLLSFATQGFFVSYALPIVAAVYVRIKGTWSPGPRSLGRWSTPVTYAAAVWILFETVNVSWPRALTNIWYLNWGVLIMTGVLGALGWILMTYIFRTSGPAAERVELAPMELETETL